METLTKKEMISNDNNYCIVSINNKDDILFIGTKLECESKYLTLIEDENNNDTPECYTIADYQFYLNM